MNKSAARIITIGTAVRDVFLRSEAFKVVQDSKNFKKLGFSSGAAQCFEAGSKIDIENAPVSTVGGGAANAAVTFARQGFRTTVIASLGEDRDGDDIFEDLKGEGVKLKASRKKKDGTGYSVLMVSPAGERTILTYRGAANDLRLADLPSPLPKADWVYITPSAIPFSVVLSMAERFKRAGSRLAMDPSHYYLALGAKKLKPLLSILDLVKMNREEASLLTGEKYDDEKAIFKAFDKMVPGLAVLTDGPRGVIVSDGPHIYRAGIFKEKLVADRTGAGDAFGSGFVSALARTSRPAAAKFSEYQIQEAIKLGTANATSVVEHLGGHTGALSAKAFKSGRRWRRLSVKVSSSES